MLEALKPSPTTAAGDWYALRVKARSEKLIAAAADRKGFEGFVPVYRCTRRWSDRTVSVEFPLFPGYVFCRTDPKVRLPLLTIPGVLHFVSVGKTPVPVGGSVLAAIRTATQLGLNAEPWPFVKVRQLAKLERGPLAGLEGLLIKTSDQYRMVIPVDPLKRSVALDVDAAWLAPRDRMADESIAGSVEPRPAAAELHENQR